MLQVEERLRLQGRRQLPPLTCAQPGATVPQPASPDARLRTYELGHSAVIRDAFAERDVMEYFAGARRSVRVNVGAPDHLAPLLGFFGNKSSKFAGRH